MFQILISIQAGNPKGLSINDWPATKVIIIIIIIYWAFKTEVTGNFL